MLVDFVTVLSRLLTSHGNRVGAMMFGGRSRNTQSRPEADKIQVLASHQRYDESAPLPRAPFTDLNLFLHDALNSIRRRSLIFVISDFISEPGWEKPLSLLNQRHEVLGVRLWDPREVELPDIGVVVMEDAETGEQLYVDTHDRKFRQRFHDAAQHGKRP